MKKTFNYFIAFLALLSSEITIAQEKSKWTFEANLGFPLNINMPLTIKQDGFADIKLTAKFKSRPLNPPPFWFLRLGKWKNNNAWELELKHQKLFLENTPPEVEYFNITHGHNQFTLNRAFKRPLFGGSDFVYRFGIGVVFAHPENSVRGQNLDEEQGWFDLEISLRPEDIATVSCTGCHTDANRCAVSLQ